MLPGRDDSGESRMREICTSGSTRERGTAVIDAIVFHSVFSSLLYRFTNCRFQRHFNALSTTFLKSAVADLVNSFGPVILTNTLPSLASMMAPSSAWFGMDVCCPPGMPLL